MSDFFEIERLVEDLAKIYSTACATSWYKVTNISKPTIDEFRNKVIEFMKQEGKDNLFLRVYVTGGGCSGLSYGMGFEENPDEDDVVLEQNGVKILVDTYSQKYLKGANVDYIESLMGSGFKISNPNVTKSCSCGHSFSTE